MVTVLTPVGRIYIHSVASAQAQYSIHGSKSLEYCVIVLVSAFEQPPLVTSGILKPLVQDRRSFQKERNLFRTLDTVLSTLLLFSNYYWLKELSISAGRSLSNHGSCMMVPRPDTLTPHSSL